MIKAIQKSTKYLLALSLVAFVSACGVDGNEGENSVENGSSQLVSATVIDDISGYDMFPYVKALKPTAQTAFGYKAIKISYNTVNEDGKSVVASGLLVIPTPIPEYVAYRESNGEKPFSVSMINENHGTIFTNAEAPTNVEISNGKPDSNITVLMTGVAGFASVVPDYIGYGDSNDVAHPYMLKKASARSSVDMIKASMKYMEDNGVVLNHQLYISGYSQGGYNAMAVAQSVENGSIENVNLMGVAPMAGPYNLEELANIEINASHTMVYPAFLGYLADSYSYFNSDVNAIDLVLEQNATKYHALFDGSNDNVAIHVNLGLTDFNGTGFPGPDYGFGTHTADKLFSPTFIAAYQADQNNIMRQKFVENSLDNWTPKSKMNFIQCVDDEIIPFSESNNTYNEFLAAGADVTLSPIPSSYLPAPESPLDFVHGRCGKIAYGVAIKWFSDLRTSPEN